MRNSQLCITEGKVGTANFSRISPKFDVNFKNSIYLNNPYSFPQNLTKIPKKKKTFHNEWVNL